MKFKTILVNSAVFLVVFFLINFFSAFLYEYIAHGTSFSEFYPTFRFGYIFVIIAVMLAIYRSKKQDNSE